jgi:hypothetical protein
MYLLEELFLQIILLIAQDFTISTADLKIFDLKKCANFAGFIVQMVTLKSVPIVDPLLAAARDLFSYGGWDRTDRPDLFTFVSKYVSLDRKTYQGEQIIAVWKALWVLLKAPKVFANKEAAVQYLRDVLALLDSFYKLQNKSRTRKREHRGTTIWKHNPYEREKRDGKVKNCLVYQ